MDTQDRLLDIKYVSARLNQLDKVKNGEIKYMVYTSDRAFSKTLYIRFYTPGDKNNWVSQKTLRISNHILEDCCHLQLIIDPKATLTKKVKESFMRIAESVINYSKKRSLYKTLEKIKKQ